MPSTSRRSAENRSVRVPSAYSVSSVHLSPIRPITWRVGQAGAITSKRPSREARAEVVTIRYVYHELMPTSLTILSGGTLGYASAHPLQDRVRHWRVRHRRAGAG